MDELDVFIEFINTLRMKTILKRPLGQFRVNSSSLLKR